MSVRASTRRGSRICSGDMYSGVPTSTPVVRDVGRVGTFGRYRLGNPEVEHLDQRLAVGGARQKKIRGLQVAMDDAIARAPRRRLARLQHVPDRFFDRELLRAA